MGSVAGKVRILPKRQTQDEVIAAFRRRHGDRYSYTKTQYAGSNQKVVVTCGEHGDFEILPGHHRNGTGCRHCYFESRRITSAQFIAKCRDAHGAVYDYELVPENVDVSKDIVEIRCTLHGLIFSQSASNHMHGHSGCPRCRSERILGNRPKQNRDFAKAKIEFVRRAQEIHGDIYDYSEFDFRGVTKKGVVKCAIHGPFEQTPNGHLGSKGCPICSGYRLSNESLKARCHELGVDYWRALKRRKAGMTDEQIFDERLIRSERRVNAVTVYGVDYPNIEAAHRALEPMASSATIARWIRNGMNPDDAFERVPNPGVRHGIIYLVESKVTGKKYVGLTVQSLERRWRFHEEQAQANGIRNLDSLHAAIRKDGVDAFTIKEIDRGQTKKDLEAKEKAWIRDLDTMVPTGHNISAGGASGGSNKRPVWIDGLRFPGVAEGVIYLMKRDSISEAAARKRLSKGRPNVRQPAAPGQSLVKTRAYKAWSHIIHTATNPRSKKDFLPGVLVHEPWREFDLFLEDMGQPRSSDLVFSRLDLAQGFFPENCAWIDRSRAASLRAIHAAEKRRSRRIGHQGIPLTPEAH
jgi:hypothetical protein